MGKWTQEHHDNVLRAKLKNLVSAAVKRARLEKGEPTITYEAFVEELDEGDSFTSSLIDMLVKEMAERRTRPNPTDRRLISERTAKSLRLQAAPPHIYRGRAHRMGRRRFFAPEYLAMNPEEMDFTEEEDELGMFGPSGAEVEGARINSSIYEAYAPTSLQIVDGLGTRHAEPSPLSSSSTDGPEFIDRELVTSPRPQSPSIPVGLRTNFWGSGASSGTALTRQNSIRRAIRSRTSDFSDFTFRRRSSNRQNSTQATDPIRPSSDLTNTRPEPIRSDDPGDGTWQFPVFPNQEDILPPPPSSAPTPRRFFPLDAWSHARRRMETMSDRWLPDPREPSPSTSNDPQDPSPPTTQNQSSSQLWYSLTSNGPPSSTLSASTAATFPPRRASNPVVAPRLRRGGIRAPESILSRYASPIVDHGTITTSTTPTLAETVTTVTTSIRESDAARIGQSSSNDLEDSHSHSWEQREEARQLLTPRSVSPATEN